VVEAEPAILSAFEGETAPFRVSVIDRRIPVELDGEMMSANLSLIWDVSDVIITSPLHIDRNDKYLAEIGMDVPLETGSVNATRFIKNKPLADVLGLKYVLSTHEIEHESLEPVLRGAVKGWRNADALPLAFLVGCVRTADGFDQAIEALKSIDVHREAVVESPTQAMPCEGGDPGTATIVSMDHGKWEIDVTADSSALLVVSETYYPGWEAQIDGEPTSIERTNALFRGVVVPKGAHRVSMSYRPPWIGNAHRLFGLGLLAALISGAPLRRRLRRPLQKTTLP
jgi:hypothetical protein